MPRQRRILQVSLGERPPAGGDRSHLTAPLAEHGVEVERFYVPSGRKPAVVASALRAAPRFSDYAAIATTEYTLAFAFGLRSILARSQTPVIALGLNLSGSIIRAGAAPLDRLLDAPFRRLALSVVHSRREMAQFKALHGISDERLAFAHWGFDLPEFDSARFAGRAPYVCMIGRNNRDFKTFCEATTRAGIDGVIIAPAYVALDFKLPGNVELYYDLPQSDCFSCIEHAQANLILVRDDERGAGHITAVAAMFLSAPQIYTEAAVLRDYLIDGVTGIAAPVGDAAAVAEAIRRVRGDAAFARAMAQKAKTYAECWLSYRATARRQAALIAAVVDDAPFARVDPDWLAAYENLAAGA